MTLNYKHHKSSVSNVHVRNSVPGPAVDNDGTFVKARWFRAASVAAAPRALLLLLAASMEIPLSDSVGLESLHTFCS